MTIGRRGGGALGAYHAGRAGDILNNEAQPGALGYPRQRHAKRDVGRATGLQRHDDVDRPRRPFGRCRAAHRERAASPER